MPLTYAHTGFLPHVLCIPYSTVHTQTACGWSTYGEKPCNKVPLYRSGLTVWGVHLIFLIHLLDGQCWEPALLPSSPALPVATFANVYHCTNGNVGQENTNMIAVTLKTASLCGQ